MPDHKINRYFQAVSRFVASITPERLLDYAGENPSAHHGSYPVICHRILEGVRLLGGGLGTTGRADKGVFQVDRIEHSHGGRIHHWKQDEKERTHRQNFERK
jgi:hypothetical protein